MKALPTVSTLAGCLLLIANLSAEEKNRPAVIGGNFKVKAIRDIAYYEGKDADPVRHKLDLFVPKDQKDFPVLFFVHGGAWRAGSKAMFGPMGTLFARNGIGLVAINYRLSPKFKHPAHIEDVARAFAWTHKNIGKYGGKTSEIFVSGHSAGGHLVALLATDPHYLKAEKLTLAAIKGVLALSGVYTIKPIGSLALAFGKDEEVCKQASPLEHVNGKNGKHPPFLICYADKDIRFIDAMSEGLGKALKKYACEATVMKLAGRGHTSILVKAILSVEDPLSQAMLRFIANHSALKLKPVTKEKK